MFRTETVTAFILMTDRMGEIHRRVTLFTAQKGLLSAIAHGAEKNTGKLKSHTELLLHGRFSLYHEPVKETWKITDVECLNSFPSFRKSLVKFYAASLFSEIVLKSFGGGEGGGELFSLFRETLYALDGLPEEVVHYLIIQYLVRFLLVIGFEFGIRECPACGRVIGGTESVYFRHRGRGFVCASCREEAGVEFSPGARAYLKKTVRLPLAEALAIRLAGRTLLELRSLFYLLVQESIERELFSLEVGKGVL